jgi:hypothetical protein
VLLLLLLDSLLLCQLLLAEIALLLVDESLANLLGPAVVNLVVLDKASDGLSAVVNLR